jgi:hypothetical protein
MRQQHAAPDRGRSTPPATPPSTGPRRLPSGAVQVGPFTVAHRAGRVYVHLDPDADPDLATGPALDLAAAVHDAALAAEAAALELDAGAVVA